MAKVKEKRAVNKAEEERKLYFALMGQQDCCTTEGIYSKDELLEHYEESQWIYEDMLRRAVETSDQYEIRSLRRALQEIKEAKRSLLAS